MKYLPLFFFVFLFTTGIGRAQEIYSLKKLSESAPVRTASPAADKADMAADTTYTYYTGGSLEIVFYFVDGQVKQYNNLFNPNPTGIYLNKQHFKFFCDPELKYKQHFSNFLDIYEFELLGRKYLCFFNFREDCVGDGCRYRCYNLFDITDKNNLVQTSFSSIYEGSECFGDFNGDGRPDFVRIAPKVPEEAAKTELENFYLITAYTLDKSGPQQLKNEEDEANYIWGKGDPSAAAFSVFRHDWLRPLKDETGSESEAVPYMPPYIAFDPAERNLFNTAGVRIEKKKWSVEIAKFTDLEGAQTLCEEVSGRNFESVFIMTDQYSNDITYHVLLGNYDNREKAEILKKTVKELYEFEGEIRDLTSRY